MSIKLDDFFEIDNFSHKALWKNLELFSALINLPSYLKKLPLGQIKSPIPKGAILTNPESIFIDEDVIIESGTLIVGPCYISRESTIRHGAFLRSNVFLAERSVVGHATEVKNSIFLEGAAAPHFAYVGDSILGRNVNLGAGVKCANLKLNRKEVVLDIEGEKVKTGLIKLGAIIGDNVQVGCNTVLNPGTVISKNAIIYPALNIGGFIPLSGVVKPALLPKIIIRRKQ